jgi:glucan phosphoethanolaminetransferase (alkaline phosphatase superfamily)
VLNPIDSDAVIRDGRIADAFPGEIHKGMAWWVAALAYADEHLGRLVDGLTGGKRWLLIMCADHGDAFGEDCYHGRGVADPTVLDMPFAAWLSE